MRILTTSIPFGTAKVTARGVGEITRGRIVARMDLFALYMSITRETASVKVLAFYETKSTFQGAPKGQAVTRTLRNL